ncbi:MAG TPA: hypothetical protein VGS12_16655 [Caulobacteraceae bacterium]|nr:hypothetical protein [Caulobacteraceae bacterium]
MDDRPVTPAELSRRDLRAAPSARLGDPFRPLEAECRVVQFGGPLTEAQLRKAGEIMSGRADVVLRAYGSAAADLGFLRHFPGLAKLQLEVFDLASLEGIDQVSPTLEMFFFGKTRKRFSVAFLTRMPRLRDLHLERNAKDLAVVGGLTELTALSFRGLTLPDLRLLLPLRDLRDLSLRLGGTRDLGLLPEFEHLERLDLMRLTGLSDLSMLGEMAGLELLTLDWLRNVTELPSFAPLRRLRHVTLDTMKGLTSLQSVAAAPALQYLKVLGTPQLRAEHFACLVGHPSLQTLDASPSGWTAYREIKKMLPGIAR